MRPNTERCFKLAFTLIELLVVVAIIALLISILLPSLNRARDQARQLVCVTQLRSQGEAANFYSEDNLGYLPRGIPLFSVIPLFTQGQALRNLSL